MAAVVLIAAAGMLVSGCSLLQPSPDETPSASPTAGDGGASAGFSVKVGDCFDYSETDAASNGVTIVPCDDPHDYEAYQSILVEGDAYPGAEAVAAQADTECRPYFDSYVGVPLEQSTLQYTSFYPTQQTWDDLRDREILCLVLDPAGKTTGSVKGVGR